MKVYKILVASWEENPLPVILFLAVFFRLLAVVFARGWGMLDDHFLVIESAQSWADGQDYNSWLPGSEGNMGPTGHNFFYPGIHYLLFRFLRFIHVNDPQEKMIIVRFLHAAWSMITVIYGYKITLKLGGEKPAKLAGILLAITWFMPWVSVRNMVEVVCIPLLIIAIYIIVLDPGNRKKLTNYFLAGVLLGLAFNLRTQTAFFSIGLGIALLIICKWREVIVMTLGAIMPVIIIQGTIDMIFWGKPFVEIIGYLHSNIIDATSYINLPWYNYFLVVLGFLLPPVSLFLFYGTLRIRIKYLFLFLPVALFFIFHSLFPNKQERFILPVLPFIMITGSLGWNEFMEKPFISRTWKKWIRGSWVFFWIINLLLLCTITVTYSKKARVETMVYLSKYKDIQYLLVADKSNNPELFPRFYLGQWIEMYDEFVRQENTDSLIIRVSKLPVQEHPRFILFSAENGLQQEVEKARKSFPFIVYETTIAPGFIDKFVRWLNPVNKNRTVYIYRNKLFYPRQIK
jgi:hypothetical protein